MKPGNVAVQVEGLGKIDLLELETSLPSSAVKLHALDASEHAYGEPGTILAIVAAGSVLLPPLLLWLAKHRWGFTLVEDETVTLPDGTKVERRVRVTVRKSAPPTAEEIHALRKLSSVDLDAVIKQLTLTDDPG